MRVTIDGGRNYILQFIVTHTLVFSVCYSLHQSFPSNSF
jgi:hypothetical protein